MDVQTNDQPPAGLPPSLSLDDIDAIQPQQPQAPAQQAQQPSGTHPQTLSLEDVDAIQPTKSWGEWGKGIAEAAGAGAVGAMGWPYDVYNAYARATGLPQTKYGTAFGESLHPPENAAERMAQSAGGLGTALFAPEATLGAPIAKAAAEYGPPAISAGARMLMEAGARPSLGAGLGMAAGTSGAEEATRQFLPQSWQSIAQPIAGLAGGIGGAGVAEGIGSIPSAIGTMREGLGWVGNENIPGTDITATPGQQQRAGAILANKAGGADALKSALNEPGVLVPGATPTLAGQTGLSGLAALQHEVEVEDPATWQEIKAKQNAAWVDALDAIQPPERGMPAAVPGEEATTAPVSAGDVPAGLRSQLAQMAARGDQEISPIQEAADAASATIPNNNVEDVGAGIVSAGHEAGAALKATRAEAYDEAAKFKNNMADMGSLKTAADEISNNIDPLDKPPSGEEKAIFDLIQNQPDAIPFGSLQALDRRVTDAMSAAKNDRSQVVWWRLNQLKNAISDSIQNAGTMAPSENVAAKTAVGESAPLISQRLPPLPPRPTGPAPTDLQTFFRRAGGLKDEGGDLASSGFLNIDGSSPRGGISNPSQKGPRLIDKANGIPMDEGRRMAAQAGYLGYNPDEAVQNTTVNDFIDRLIDHPAYSIHDDDAVAQRENYKRAVEARAQAKDESASSQLNLSDEADRVAAETGVPWHDAFEGVVRNLHERIAPATPGARQGNEGIGVSGTEPGAQTGPVRTSGGIPNASQMGISGGAGEGAGSTAAAQALAAAKQSHISYAKFKQGPVGKSIETTGFSDQYAQPAALAPETIFPKGPAGFDAVNQVRRDLGPVAMKHLENAASVSLTKDAVRGADGVFDPKKFAVWEKNYGPALRAAPEIATKFSTAAKAFDNLNQAVAAKKTAIDGYNSGIIGRVMKLEDPEDVTKAVGSILEKGTAADVERLANESARTPGGKEGLRKAAIDAMLQKFTSGTDVIAGNSFQKFVRANQSKLGKIFEPDEVGLMNKVADDIARTQRTFTQSRLSGQPPTTPDMVNWLKKGELKTGNKHGMTWPSVVGAIALEHMMPEILAGHFLGPAAGVSAAVLGTKAISGVTGGAKRYIGGNLARNVPELVSEALLNRTGDGVVARALAAKLPKTGDVPALRRALVSTSNAILNQGVH
jgi:hypothetical protein